MRSIYDISSDELKDYFVSKGLKPYRATQLFEAVYRQKVNSFDDITTMKKEVIEELKKDFTINTYEVVVHQKSIDGTEKFLFKLEDGNLIETVLMTHNYGTSVCVTSEVGCNMTCAFCASGMHKKLRNLTAGEMVMQIMSVIKESGRDVSHIVVMGIGEPFDNYDNVMRFLRIVNNAHGLEIGARHISVSTCGLVPKIYDYASENLQSNLAISLHAPNNEIRDQIMPINKAYRIEELVKAISDYIKLTNRRVTIEYILINDLNDSVKCANELADLLHGLNVYINLIPYNEVKEKPFKRSTKEHMTKFYDQLKKRSMNVTLRLEQGSDIDAACGQLRSNNIKK